MALLQSELQHDVLSEALAGDLRTLFQPIVELDGRRTVGYEALSRGPAGSFLERPDRLFAEARRRGLLSELDLACRRNAIAAAAEVGIGSPQALFVNVEPDALLEIESEGSLESKPLDRPPLVFEVTERALFDRPAELLRNLERVRERGWQVAIDDVGADTRSLALMPFLQPDVIKLDLQLVQRRPNREIAAIVNAVRAEAERSGARILAEGIETEQHLETAIGLGAILGQGYLFGRPAATVERTFVDAFTTGRSNARAVPETPYGLLGQICDVRASRKPLLIEISKQLEAEAVGLGETATVVAAFQDAAFFTPKTIGRYQELATTTGFVAAIATGLEPEPARGVRGIQLDPDDPLGGEWTIAVVAPHYAACLSARDLGDDGPEHDRRFDYVLTFDRSLAIAAAQSLLTRI